MIARAITWDKLYCNEEDKINAVVAFPVLAANLYMVSELRSSFMVDACGVLFMRTV